MAATARASPMNGDWRPRFSHQPLAAKGTPLAAKVNPESNTTSNGAMPSLLAQLEMDYMKVQRTDQLLHEHLGSWLSHMEQWMHCQQDMFKQIQTQCNYLGLSPFEDPEMVVRSDAKQACSFDDSLEQAHGKKPRPPRLPAAVRMTADPIEQVGSGIKVDTVTAVSMKEFEVGRQLTGGSELPTPVEWDPSYLDGAGAGRSAPSKALKNAKNVKNADNGVFTEGVNVALLEANDFDEAPLSEGISVAMHDIPMSESYFEEPQRSRGLCFSLDDGIDLKNIETTKYNDGIPLRENTDMSVMEASNEVWRSIDAEAVNSGGVKKTTFLGPMEDPADSLPQEYQMWVQIVDLIIQTAKNRKFFELRKEWIQPDAWVTKVMRNHPGLDLRCLVVERKEQRTSSASATGSGTPSKFNRMTMRGPLRPRSSVTANIVGKTSSQGGYDRNSNKSYDRNSSKSNRSSNSVSGRRQRSSSERFVLDPQSPVRLVWMSVGMVLMLYDLMVLPLNQAFVLPESDFLTVMGWFTQVFWTLDIGVTFMTGVYLNSELVTDLRAIARTYTTTWLPFDIAVVAPLWIVQFVNVGRKSEGAAKAGVFRFVRMVRFLRLARLAKFEHYLQEALAAINSSSLILCVGIFKLMVMMIILSHLNACCWYAVGSSGTGGWVDAYEGTSLFYKYLTSMHWAFTQFQGTSEILPGMGEGKLTGERAYAVLCVMFALIILSFFVSSLTNMMMQLQALRNERVGMYRAVREYLNDNAISKGLSMRVKKYIDWKQRMQRKMGHADKVLEMLPVALQMDLQEEVRGPLVFTHRFFASVKHRHGRTFRILAHEALQPLSPTPGEMVFSKQDEATRMYFVVSGLSRYMPTKLIPDQRRLKDYHEEVRRTLINPAAVKQQADDGQSEERHSLKDHGVIKDVGTGCYLCEPVLWTTGWEHRGIFMGVSDSHYLVLTSKDFCKIMCSNQPSLVSSILYARQFIAGLNRFGKTYNDIIDLSALCETEDDY